ncbi:MAG: riboflavin synthase [Chloroflexi bacterium]|nr:riboflavin synthase [Chloroflexota bacterium]
MFTGIVEETGKILSAQPGRLAISAAKVLVGTELGSSIAVNGVCLTVAGLDSRSFSVDVMAETLQRTNLGQLRSGDMVNLERAMALGGQMGGHLVQGHIDGTGRLVSVARDEGAVLLRFQASPEIMRYVVEKGFIAVDGISLTVVDHDADSFRISIVDFTWQHTTLSGRRVGDSVNLEADIIAKYVERFTRPRDAGLTMDFLQANGFLAR